MSKAVLADAQFSAARVFRPYEGFEVDYQGKPVSVPIAIPGTLDRDAGKTGFDPNLISGIPVPMGSKLILWVPTIFNSAVPNLSVQDYQYRFIWRVRNLRDFREARSAYHFPRQSFGTNNQFVVPSCGKVVIQGSVLQDYPTNGTVAPTSAFFSSSEVRSQAATDNVAFVSGVPDPPLVSGGGTGSFQQGLAESDAGSNQTVTFNALQMDVEGDELIILVNRPFTTEDPNNTWNFEAMATDAGFSAFYGTDNQTRSVIRDMGIYVFTGSNP